MSSTMRRLASAIDLIAFWMSSAENEGLTTDELVIFASGPNVVLRSLSVVTSSGGSISVVRTSTPPPATAWMVASSCACDEKNAFTAESSGRVANETYGGAGPANA